MWKKKKKMCGRIELTRLKSSRALGGIRLSVEEVSFSRCSVMKCVLNVQRENVSLENGEIKSILLLASLTAFFVKKYFLGWGEAQPGCKSNNCL